MNSKAERVNPCALSHAGSRDRWTTGIYGRATVGLAGPAEAFKGGFHLAGNKRDFRRTPQQKLECFPQLRARFEFESHVLQDGLDVRRKRTIRASTLDVFWAKYIMRPI